MMYSFLAKSGRRSWAKPLVEFAGCMGCIGYMGYHVYGQPIVKKLYSAGLKDGAPEVLEEGIQNIILRVYKDIEPTYAKPFYAADFWKQPPPKVEFFASCTMDPVTIGMTESYQGVTIGIPVNYNYNKPEDVPSHVFLNRNLSLFKTSEDQKKEEETNAYTSPDCESCLPGDMQSIDRNHPMAKDYIDSLVLSEKAKMFSIARELYLADTYRIFTNTLVIFGSFFLSLALSRAFVMVAKLQNAHVTQRMLVYMVAGSFAVFHYILFAEMLERYYTQISDERAMKVGETYREGAKEFFSKLLQRNKATRNLMEPLKTVYDEDGEVIQPLYKFCYLTIKERIKNAEELEEKLSDNK